MVDILIFAYALCFSVAFIIINSRLESPAWAAAKASDHFVADLKYSHSHLNSC